MIDNTTPDFSRLAMRTIAMPKDANPSGDIFGGWLVSQMDLAGASAARRHTKGRVTTVAIKEMAFLKPVNIGDEVSCYASIIKVGHTSLTIEIEVWTFSSSTETLQKVAQGSFVFVALDEKKQPRPINTV